MTESHRPETLKKSPLFQTLFHLWQLGQVAGKVGTGDWSHSHAKKCMEHGTFIDDQHED